MSVSAKPLVELLDLERIDTTLFRGRQPDTDRQRVFGGQVAAQALVAGARTVEPAYGVHSLHSYFLLPGDTSVPIVYDAGALVADQLFVIVDGELGPVFAVSHIAQADQPPMSAGRESGHEPLGIEGGVHGHRWSHSGPK